MTKTKAVLVNHLVLSEGVTAQELVDDLKVACLMVGDTGRVFWLKWDIESDFPIITEVKSEVKE